MSGLEASLVLGLYFLPILIAGIRHHNNGWPIVLVNILLGWTAIGWIVALIWSLTDNTPKK